LLNIEKVNKRANNQPADYPFCISKQRVFIREKPSGKIPPKRQPKNGMFNHMKPIFDNFS
jgi:hypothetical protein